MEHDEQPFFSILLPTKNRSELVGEAIESVLSQTFESYELIVVDNDDSDSTCTIVSSYDDHSLKYYRTGGLSMVENWEYAYEKANGKYVTVLEDKLSFYNTALEDIYNIVCAQNSVAVVWGIDEIKRRPK